MPFADRVAGDNFADAMEAVAALSADPVERLGRLGEASLRRARTEPHGDRIMLELAQPHACDYPALHREEARAWAVLRNGVAATVEAGAVEGNPDIVAHVLWAGLHGLAALDLAGKRTLVLESHYVAGGNTQTFRRKLKSGLCEFDVGAHYLGEWGKEGSITRILRSAGLDERLNFRSLDPDGFTTLIFPGLTFKVPASWDRYRARLLDSFPDEDFVHVTVTSLKDSDNPRVAPRGTTNLQIMTLVPRDYAAWNVGAGPVDLGDYAYHQDAEYRRRKMALAERLITTGERIIPELRSHIVWKEAATPVTEERFTRSTGGTSYGIEFAVDQMGPLRIGPGTGSAACCTAA